MQQITNNTGISLALAVWLVDDVYDFQPAEKAISMTTLLKPLRQIILQSRLSMAPPGAIAPPDVSDFIARRVGQSLHEAIEKAWTERFQQNLRILGHPESVISKVRINPTQVDLEADPMIIPCYIEQRATREVAGWKVSGKFDMVLEGILQDTKSTSAWAWAKGTRDEEHIQQMSGYRWIDAAQPHPKITEDFFEVNYIFTDWAKGMAKSNPNYPNSRLQNKKLLLMSEQDTESFISGKIRMIEEYWNVPEAQIPECTDEELWRSDPVYKYYRNPADATDPTKRASKNCDTLAEAHAYMASKGGAGTVKTVLSEPKRCGFCDGFPLCTQKDKYL